MGVDYERLAFWEELAFPVYPELYGTRLARLFKTPDTSLDRERLKAALITLDLDLPIGLRIDDIVEGVADRIYHCWIEYRKKTHTAGPSKKLRNLHKALSEWLDEHIDDQEGYHIHKGDSQKKDALVQLMRESGELIAFMHYDKPKGKQEHPRTTFFRRLYHLYVDLSEKRGLSNDGYGPGVRFVLECAALVHIGAPLGLRQLILGSISRAARAKMDPE
jgi:hypothetical protein